MNTSTNQLIDRIVELEQDKRSRIRRHGAALEEIKAAQIEAYTTIGYNYNRLDREAIESAEQLLIVTGSAVQDNHRAQQLVDNLIKKMLYRLEISFRNCRMEKVLLKNKWVVMQYGENYFRRHDVPRTFDPGSGTLFMVEAKVGDGAYVTPVGIRAMAYYLSNLKAIQSAKTAGLEAYKVFVTNGAV